jgi:tetratricopeptide (TPR) repeat protein
MLALLPGEQERAQQRLEEALGLHTELKDDWGAANALFLLGHVATDQGRFEDARDAMQASHDRFLALGDEHYTLLTKFNLAWAYGELGDVERDRRLTQETLDEARAAGDKRIEAISCQSLAIQILATEGPTDETLELVGEAYRLHVEIGELLEVPDALSAFARILVERGRLADATRIVARWHVLNEEMGGGTRAYIAARNEKTFAAIRAGLDDDTFARAWDEGLHLSNEEAVELALESRTLAD